MQGKPSKVRKTSMVRKNFNEEKDLEGKQNHER